MTALSTSSHLAMHLVHSVRILKPLLFQNRLYCAGSNGELFQWKYNAAVCGKVKRNLENA